MQRGRPIYLAGLTVAFTGLIGFMSYGLARTNFTHLLIGYALMFILYLLMVRHAIIRTSSYRKTWAPILILFHVIPVFALPNLSDDYFRFVWDARLFSMGINPFDHLPSELVAGLDASMQQLYSQLNSPDYYSVYPPWNQAVYQMGVILSPGKHLRFGDRDEGSARRFDTGRNLLPVPSLEIRWICRERSSFGTA